MEQKFLERFVDFLETESETGRRLPDFVDVCAKLSIPADEFDRELVEEFGVCGADIVRSYRTFTPVDFLW